MTRALLLVGNDVNILYLLRRYAEENRFEAVCLTLDEDPVTVAQQVAPAAIILQVGPPRGEDLLHQLRQRVATRDIPVVTYIGLGEETDHLVVGAAGCLRDPVSLEDFTATLEYVGVSPESRPP